MKSDLKIPLPSIIINNIRLSDEQTLTFRVALDFYLQELKREETIHHSKIRQPITARNLQAGNQIFTILHAFSKKGIS